DLDPPHESRRHPTHPYRSAERQPRPAVDSLPAVGHNPGHDAGSVARSTPRRDATRRRTEGFGQTRGTTRSQDNRTAVHRRVRWLAATGEGRSEERRVGKERREPRAMYG